MMVMRKSIKSFYTLFVLLLLSIFFITCRKKTVGEPIEITKPDLIFYAINSNNEILKFNANAVDTPLAKYPLSLSGSDTIIDIDFRPATGELYALSSTNYIYIFTRTLAGYGTGIEGINVSFTPPVSGAVASIDFNPTSDKIRFINSSGQNLRIDPETAAVFATDANINGVTGAAVSGSAYSGNTAGSSNTTLYNIDIINQKLYKQNSSNNGTLIEAGSLGIKATEQGGFDISPDGIALAAFTVNGESNLYKIDTTSGNAILLGKFGSASPIKCIAIPTKPVAYALDDANNLLIFDLTHPSNIIAKPITGLASGETLLGIDFRGNRQLYALGSTNRIYTLDASSGVAAQKGNSFSPKLSGTDFGIDFYPFNNLLRIISNTGQNIALDPNFGTVFYADFGLNPPTASVSAIAYSNTFDSRNSRLFGIDYLTDKLYYLNGNNLVEIGPLGIDIEASGDFDIAATSGIAYGIFKAGGTQGIYTVNLTTGKATKLNDFPKAVKGFTVGFGF